MAHRYISIIFAIILLLVTQMALSARDPDSRGKLAILELPFFGIRGAFSYVIENYSRLRDYYARPNQLNIHLTHSYFYPWLVVSNIVTSAANRTLIEPEDLCDYVDNCDDDAETSNIPKILPRLPVVVVFEGYDYSALSIWDNHCSLSKRCGSKFSGFSRFGEQREVESPSMSLVKSELINFAYCAVPQKVRVSSWAFGIFTDPFGNIVWIVLSISFTILSLVMYISKQSQTLTMLLSMFSAMILNSTHVSLRNSRLFMLWTFASIILINFYTADITSTVISPPPDDVITSFRELDQRNFTLHEWKEESYIKFLNNSVSAMKPNSPTRRVLESIFTKAILDITLENFVGSIIFGENKFIIHTWEIVMYLASLGHREIKKKEHIQQEKIERKCYVGKELIRYDEIFFATLPSGNRELADRFQKLLDFGIVQRFYQEMEGVVTSERVQDRSRIVGRTNMKGSEDSSPESLKLRGKAVTIFLLWIFCAAISLGWFICELCFGRMTTLN